MRQQDPLDRFASRWAGPAGERATLIPPAGNTYGRFSRHFEVDGWSTPRAHPLDPPGPYWAPPVTDPRDPAQWAPPAPWWRRALRRWSR